MKILFVTARNPRFPTITEYVERAVRFLGHTVLTFDDRDFLFPGRLRRIIPSLGSLELKRLNSVLRDVVRWERPDILLCAGGDRIFPETVEAVRMAGIRTVLWTIDPLKPLDPRLALAPHFDFVFCGGTEMVEALRGSAVRNGPHWLPFACDPEIHQLVDLTPDERARYGCDIAFVGSLHREMYPNRIAMLEALADFDMAVWGPGARDLPPSSSIRSKVRGDDTRVEDWTRIYSAAKIILCAHYAGPGPPCQQASPRVYEIMACGGFLLCDDQPDVRTLFRDGRDLAIFQKDLTDLRQIVQYYLNHDEARREIASRGRAKVLANHTYRHRIAGLIAGAAGVGSPTQVETRSRG